MFEKANELPRPVTIEGPIALETQPINQIGPEIGIQGLYISVLC